jgi:lysozyme
MSGRWLHLARDLGHEFEGLHRVGKDGLIYPYHDPVGVPTQGWGRLLSRVKWEALSKYHPITRAEADEWFERDLVRHARAVWALCPVPMTPGQFAALTDFSFNAGPGNLEISALRRRLLRGDYEGAANQFPRWVYAQGIKLPGLVRRRAAERDLFLKE